MVDAATKSTVQKIPLLSIRAGPRGGDEWTARLKQELKSLIEYVRFNKELDNDWFNIEPDSSGTKWKGTCWTFVDQQRYEFALQFEIPVSYPETPIELELPQLEGKTPKMYRGGKICLDVHFKPLWSKNTPRFGIAHALALGLAPWLAAEIPVLVGQGHVQK